MGRCSAEGGKREQTGATVACNWERGSGWILVTLFRCSGEQAKRWWEITLSVSSKGFVQITSGSPFQARLQGCDHVCWGRQAFCHNSELQKRYATASSTAKRCSSRDYAMQPVMEGGKQVLGTSGGNTPTFGDSKTSTTLKHRKCRKLEHVSARSAVHQRHVSETLTHNPSHGTVKSAAIQYLLGNNLLWNHEKTSTR